MYRFMKPSKQRVPDLRLKIAILESGSTQRRVAVDTRIGETRLSEIVGRRGAPASEDEMARLAKHLRREIRELFAVEELGRHGKAAGRRSA
jgi:hypothetical protein